MSLLLQWCLLEESGRPIVIGRRNRICRIYTIGPQRGGTEIAIWRMGKKRIRETERHRSNNSNMVATVGSWTQFYESSDDSNRRR